MGGGGEGQNQTRQKLEKQMWSLHLPCHDDYGPARHDVSRELALREIVLDDGRRYLHQLNIRIINRGEEGGGGGKDHDETGKQSGGEGEERDVYR